MTNNRTKEEIKLQVEGLCKMKNNLPRTSFFGTDNWKVIDAQIAILHGDAVSDDYYVDEHTEDYEDGDNDLWSEAARAERWLNGEEDEDLFDANI